MVKEIDSGKALKSLRKKAVRILEAKKRKANKAKKEVKRG